MRFTLPESSHRRQRSPRGALLSVALHAAVIGATVVATGLSTELRPTKPPPLETLVYIEHPPKTTIPTDPSRTPPTRPPTITPPDIQTTVVPPVDVVDPTVVPTTLPAISERLASAVDMAPTRISTSGGSETAAFGEGALGGDTPMSALMVDREVVPLHGVAPQYPSMLASAGVEGLVIARFVVDTLGRVERGSVEMTRSDNALFEQSVRAALTRMRFVPAEAGGRKVRQLVQQPFAFAISRR